MRQAFCAGLLCVLAATAAAEDYRADAESYRDHLRRLQPGDRLLLDPGDYRRGLPLSNLSGTSGQPIVIEALDPTKPPRFIARPGPNSVSLVDFHHLVVRNLELDGRNVLVDAVKAKGMAAMPTSSRWNTSSSTITPRRSRMWVFPPSARLLAGSLKVI